MFGAWPLLVLDPQMSPTSTSLNHQVDHPFDNLKATSVSTLMICQDYDGKQPLNRLGAYFALAIGQLVNYYVGCGSHHWILW